MGTIIDLTGQRFGRLTVLSRIDKKGASQWNCICDCGKETVVYSSNLRRGLTKSCGCYRKDYLSETKLQDITGNRYGRLTVISLHHRDETTRQHYWLCQCDCGGTAVVYSGHLKDGHTQSCGCINSVGEENIAGILDKYNIPFQKQYKFTECRGLREGLLRFDFAIFDEHGIKALIEYDGKQHRVKTDTKWDNHGKFEERQANDEIKNIFCQEQNIRLIRISHPSWDIEGIEQILKDNDII